MSAANPLQIPCWSTESTNGEGVAVSEAVKNRRLSQGVPTSDEIKHEVMEFWHCLQGKNVHDPSDALLQKRFWKALEIWPDYRKFRGWLHPNCKVSSTWLKNAI